MLGKLLVLVFCLSVLGSIGAQLVGNVLGGVGSVVGDVGSVLSSPSNLLYLQYANASNKTKYTVIRATLVNDQTLGNMFCDKCKNQNLKPALEEAAKCVMDDFFLDSETRRKARIIVGFLKDYPEDCVQGIVTYAWTIVKKDVDHALLASTKCGLPTFLSSNAHFLNCDENWTEPLITTGILG